MQVTLARKLVAEGVGTALLVAAVVGSGIMAQTLARDPALALLCNTIATGAALVAILLVFGPISGAHLNPVVTLLKVATGDLPGRAAIAFVGVQIAGAIAGAVLANIMFDLAPVSVATNLRGGVPVLVSEVVATFGLVGVVVVVGRTRGAAAPFAVAAYITAAYWFTASTSFANPAVTIGRAFSDTYAGIAPVHAAAFIGAQLVGGILGGLLFTWLVAPHDATA